MLNESKIDFDVVLFDFDNTLVDTASVIKEAYNVVFSRIAEDFNIDKERLLEEADKFQKHKLTELAWSKQSYNHADWIAEIAAKFLIYLGNKAEDYKQMFYFYVTNNPKFSADTIQLLEQLNKNGKKIALLSEMDSIEGMKLTRINKVPFSKYFDSIIIAGETIPYRKASDGAKPFIAAANILGFDPTRIVMVGDRPDLDIQNAKEAGMKAILFTGYSESTEHSKYTPDFTVKDMLQLKNLLLK